MQNLEVGVGALIQKQEYFRQNKEMEQYRKDYYTNEQLNTFGCKLRIHRTYKAKDYELVLS